MKNKYISVTANIEAEVYKLLIEECNIRKNNLNPFHSVSDIIRESVRNFFNYKNETITKSEDNKSNSSISKIDLSKLPTPFCRESQIISVLKMPRTTFHKLKVKGHVPKSHKINERRRLYVTEDVIHWAKANFKI